MKSRNGPALPYISLDPLKSLNLEDQNEEE